MTQLENGRLCCIGYLLLPQGCCSLQLTERMSWWRLRPRQKCGGARRGATVDDKPCITPHTPYYTKVATALVYKVMQDFYHQQ